MREDGRSGVPGGFLPAVAFLLSGLGLVSGLGCATATPEFDRLFEAGHYAEAARAFEADSVLHADERALFRTGVAHALPGSAAHDPARARTLFERLLSAHPGTEYRQQTAWILALMEHAEEWRRAAARARNELERMKEIDLRRPPPDSGSSRPPPRR